MNVALRAEGVVDILSLCTGGAGLDLGVELALPGARTVCMVEREAFAVAHLVSAMEQGLLHPAAVWSDARTFDGRAWRGCVDGLIGGIPCQPHSLAGRKRGQNDERDLWSSARRIIVQSGVWFVLIENVAGMLSAGDDEIAGAERVWRDLRKLGFAVEIGLFTAAEVGAPHERARVFILGVAAGCNEQGEGQGNPSEMCGFSAQKRGPENGATLSGRGGTKLADSNGERLEGQRPLGRARRRQDAGRPSGLCDGAVLVDAPRLGWRKRRAEPELSKRHGPAVDVPSAPMAHATIARSGTVSIRSRRQDEADANIDRTGLFPPGPRDIDAWRNIAEFAADRLPALSRHDRFRLALRAARIAADGDPDARQGLDPLGPYGLRAALVQELAESHLRGLDDGMASRVDRLRMLGNGVVSLEAAYALRTLATRLAAVGSAGAARLVRMMEG